MSLTDSIILYFINITLLHMLSCCFWTLVSVTMFVVLLPVTTCNAELYKHVCLLVTLQLSLYTALFHHNNNGVKIQ